MCMCLRLVSGLVLRIEDEKKKNSASTATLRSRGGSLYILFELL